MVHPQCQPLLALALEGLEKAKTLFLVRLFSHFATLGFAMVAAVALAYDLPAVEIAAAIAAAGSEFVALYFHHRAMELHGAGRQAMRRVMLLDALRPEDAAAQVAEFAPRFKRTVQEATAAPARPGRRDSEPEHGLAKYYWSDKPTGPERLRDHLYESALFSHQLYSAAWKFSLTSMILLVFVAGVILYLLSGGTTKLGLHMLIALVAFLPACHELDHLLLYRMAAHDLAGLLPHVKSLYATALPQGQIDPALLAQFGDYSAATTYAPPIRTFVYRALADRLRREFEAEMQQLGQAQAPAG